MDSLIDRGNEVVDIIVVVDVVVVISRALLFTASALYTCVLALGVA